MSVKQKAKELYLVQEYAYMFYSGPPNFPMFSTSILDYMLLCSKIRSAPGCFVWLAQVCEKL